jgi:hypothetical protein
MLDNVHFNAPDHLAQAAAIDAALQVWSLSLASMDDPEDDYVTALPFSFAEDPCVADIPHSASWVIAAAVLDLLPDGHHMSLIPTFDSLAPLVMTFTLTFTSGPYTQVQLVLWMVALWLAPLANNIICCTFAPLADPHIKLRVANNTPHVPRGVGFLCVPACTLPSYINVKCYWTPSMPASILSPYAIGMQYGCHGYSIRNEFAGTGCTFTFHHHLCQSQDFSIALTLEHGLLFFDLPSPAAHTATPVPLPAVKSVSINAKE